jgi:hypothetical protein
MKIIFPLRVISCSKKTQVGLTVMGSTVSNLSLGCIKRHSSDTASLHFILIAGDMGSLIPEKITSFLSTISFNDHSEGFASNKLAQPVVVVRIVATPAVDKNRMNPRLPVSTESFGTTLLPDCETAIFERLCIHLLYKIPSEVNRFSSI